MRSIPYVPAFATTPESTAVTSGGASRYASGSQPWNGKSGALIAKASMNPRKSHRLALGGEHHERAGDRGDEQLDRRADAVRAAPHADEDVERDQHRLEERVEEEQVLGDEHADGRAREHEHQPEVRARPVAADPEAVADARRHHDNRQAGEPEREPVLAHVVRDVQVLDPRS